MDKNKSAVAQIRAQIDAECQGMQHLRLFSAGASHEAIKHLYRRLANYHDQLELIMGNEAATATIVDIYDNAIK